MKSKPKIVKTLSTNKSGNQGKVLVLNHLLSGLVTLGNSLMAIYEISVKYLLSVLT